MATGSWDSILQEWLIDTGTCCAAALAQRADFQLYAAAPTADEAGWKLCHKEDREEPIMQDDGTEKNVAICEANTLKDAVNCYLQKEGPPKLGLWMGGEKYKIVQQDREFESGDNKVIWLFASRTKKGLHIIATAMSVIVCMYDETTGQTSGNCKKAAIEMAEYLISEGL